MTVQLGWIDTNIFIHLLFTRDREYKRCRAISDALERGEAEGWLDITVIHELTYYLSRHRNFPDRTAICDYIRTFLEMDAIRANDKAALRDVLLHWQTQRVGFIDAWLAIRATRQGMPVCSANESDYPATLDNSFRTAKLEQEEEGE
jgi:predicted nucleic acid-binding protein